MAVLMANIRRSGIGWIVGSFYSFSNSLRLETKTLKRNKKCIKTEEKEFLCSENKVRAHKSGQVHWMCNERRGNKNKNGKNVNILVVPEVPSRRRSERERGKTKQNDELNREKSQESATAAEATKRNQS